MPDSAITKKRIAILGGGPSGLFIYKRLVDAGRTDFTIDIFEAKRRLGEGMPYSADGANIEHITNVSGSEIPVPVTSLTDWVESLPQDTLDAFAIDRKKFDDDKVMPRLMFGQYLGVQFDLLLQKAKASGLTTKVHFDSPVTDITDRPESGTIVVEIAGGKKTEFGHVVLCTGHNWPKSHEGRLPGYFDSPYPPSKLAMRLNHAIAIKGSSLTAIDAVRTLARHNGAFVREGRGLLFRPHEDADDFRIVLHSRHGFLPCVRFHLEDPHISSDSLLSKEEIARDRADNDGFLTLDFIFEKDFKDLMRNKDPVFYDRIKDMSIEEFVEAMTDMREQTDAFLFFRAEYEEARQSIRRKESIHWKEMLAVLSYAMNYPAKYMSAEDMLRLQRVLMPLVSTVIAFVPQTSCEELIALHEAGRLELKAVGADSHIDPCPEGGATYHHTDSAGQHCAVQYKTYIDCVGQPHLSLDAFPFKSLVEQGAVVQARLKFRSAQHAEKLISEGQKNIEKDENGAYYLRVPGFAISDIFQPVDRNGVANPHLYIMAVPYIGGYNPDYSGLDFCDEASSLIANKILELVE